MNKITITLALIFVYSISYAGDYLVVYKGNKSNFVKKLKNVETKNIGKNFPNLLQIKTSEKNNKKIEKFLKTNSNILYFEKNHTWSLPKFERKGLAANTMGLAGITNDRYSYLQWPLHNPSSGKYTPYKVDLNAEKTWKISKGSKSIKIAVIDTGIDFKHEDLKDNIYVNQLEKDGSEGVDDDGNGYVDDIYGYDFVNDRPNAMDDNGHGTHCAGIIGAIANNEIGVAGIMPEVSLIPIKFLDKNGGGDTANAIRSIDYAIEMGVDIMSNSWGSEEPSKLLYDAVKRAGEKGIVFVAAAGNYGMDIDSNDVHPAIFARTLDNVITVASHDSSTKLSSFSDFGINTVIVAAPGGDIASTVPNNDYDSFSGTSMATPYVAGSIGLLLEHKGKLSFKEIKDRIKETSIPSTYLKKTMSGGRLNTYNLLSGHMPTRPNESDWKTHKLETPFETDHPYEHGKFQKATFIVPGAKFIRVIVKKYDFYKGFDELVISVPAPLARDYSAQEITGKGSNFISEYADGDRIHVKFDPVHVSEGNWGVLIEEVQYID
jgi:thermitase